MENKSVRISEKELRHFLSFLPKQAQVTKAFMELNQKLTTSQKPKVTVEYTFENNQYRTSFRSTMDRRAYALFHS